MCANLTYQVFQADSKGPQPLPDDRAVVPPIHIVEKSQSELFTKNWHHGRKKNQTKYFEKIFLAAQKKVRYDLWTAHQHIHGWNFKKLVFQTILPVLPVPVQILQVYAPLQKATQRELQCRLHTGQKLETKAGQKPCLSRRSASENYGCWQINVISVCNLDRKFKAHIGKKILIKNLWQAHLQFVATHLLYRGTESH